MNIPFIRKDDPHVSLSSRSLGNSRDELIRQLAERARSQRLRHQLERMYEGTERRPGSGDAATESAVYSRSR